MHYPTDRNLLYDATRKTIELTAKIADSLTLTEYRQAKHQIRKCKCQLRTIENTRRSNSKNEAKKTAKEEELKSLHKEYIKSCKEQFDKATRFLTILENEGALGIGHNTERILYFIGAGRTLIDQIERRVLNGETIPHSEKIFSLFEPHTEWIVKGKAGVSQELGLRVCVVTDQYGFTLTHRIMQKELDVDIAVEIMKDAKDKFTDIHSVSFDKGFWSKKNKEDLEQLIDSVALPKKGKLSIADKEHQHSDDYKEAKDGHSAVESAINAHENHGLDKCPDSGIIGFRRYVALAVLGRNIQHLGAQLIKKQNQSKQHSNAIKQGLPEKLTA